MRNICSIVFLIFAFFISSPAQAYMFGEKQSVEKISDINLKSNQNEKLYLGHLVVMHFFLLGTYVEDKGYVLGVWGDSEKYYPFPTPEIIEKLQKSGGLPNPLPPSKLNMFHYLIGYSLYWIPIAILLQTIISKKLKRRKLKM